MNSQENNSKYDYDLFVIGAGSGGVRTARWSAGLGAKVGICEEYRYGGTCVIRGCVPKKLMVYASEFGKEAKLANEYGWKMENHGFDWTHLKTIRDQEVQRLSDIYIGLLDGKSVDHFEGKGVLLDPHTVQVGDQKFTAERILIATGARPFFPANVEGIEHAISSNEIFELENKPKSVLIVGGGFIAVEFLCILDGLGIDTELSYRGRRILKTFDEDTTSFLQEELIKAGKKIRHEVTLNKIIKSEKGYRVEFSDGSTGEYEVVFYATGRIPNIEGLGLDSVGVELSEKGTVKVNDHFQTNIPSIYAIGDVSSKLQLTPVATTEGTKLAEHWFNGKEIQMSYDLVPSAVFTSPPLSFVGPTEQELVETGKKIDVYTSDFRAMKYTLTSVQERTFFKMIVDAESRKVLALHGVGKDLPEMIQLGAVALKAGATKEDFDSTIGIHPTSAEEFVTLRTKRD